MTLLASWIGVDTHGPSSAYIVADSRITWSQVQYYDYGKKVFASKSYPEIFGYAGDVLFPSIVLSQILEMIDSGLLFRPDMSCHDKNGIVYEKLCHSFSKYPDAYGDNPIQVIHISRETVFQGYPSFYHYSMTWSQRNGWRKCEKTLPSESGLIAVLGSGGHEFSENYEKRYQEGLNKSTSRNVFHCFIDTLSNITTYQCGGAPQLVGIYRKPLSSAKSYGIIYNNKRYFLGMEIPDNSSFEKIEWRNERFELCDGASKLKIEGAASQKDSLRR